MVNHNTSEADGATRAHRRAGGDGPSLQRLLELHSEVASPIRDVEQVTSKGRER
jgi:hypothetical protein